MRRMSSHLYDLLNLFVAEKLPPRTLVAFGGNYGKLAPRDLAESASGLTSPPSGR